MSNRNRSDQNLFEPPTRDLQVGTVRANGIEVEVADVGEGPAVLLLHGFPHTWRLWSEVIPALARTHRVLAADLRGLGGSTRAAGGYDAGSQARDVAGVLDALALEHADVVAIDAGVPPAFVFAMQHPERVRRLVLMEAVLGRLPGAEDFFAGGSPWWFGFHAVPGFAETVLAGHEDAYLDYFYRAGTADGRGISGPVRDAFVDAYRGELSLRCAFEHYRAMPTSAQQIEHLVDATRLTVPTLAVGAHPVGDALHRQLQPIANDLHGEVLADCGHLVPLDRPAALISLLEPFLAGDVQASDSTSSATVAG